jgi:hypothetical protein
LDKSERLDCPSVASLPAGRLRFAAAAGLTGDKSDVPLLLKHYHHPAPRSVWGCKIRDAAEASLARLGSKEHIDNIEEQLRKPVSDPIQFEEACALDRAIKKAGFTGNTRFVPLLRKHLKTQHAQLGCIVVLPAHNARRALIEILGEDWEN